MNSNVTFAFLGGGERMGRPSLSPPPKKQRLHLNSFPALARLNINLMHKVITWGKTVVHMVNGVGKTQPVNYLVQNMHKT